jgi:hypothetical protein
MNTRAIRSYRWADFAAMVGTFAFCLMSVPADAQYTPRPLNDPATGEQYHIEGAFDLWLPGSELVLTSSGSGALSGLPGSEINAKRDLGFTDEHFPALHLQLRPAKSHKFRLQYIPIGYTGTGTLNRPIDFNGIRYNIGVQVNSTMDWKAYRFGYEYDFVTKNRGFVGFILEAKYTDVQVALNSPFAQEFARARGPIPAIGGIARMYVVPNISITADITGFKIPDSIDSRYNAHYVDIDIFGTLNFTNNIGVKGGYRSLDVGYLIKSDTGQFTVRGIYFGAVVRY